MIKMQRWLLQRRLSGLKSRGSWIRVNKISIFPVKFQRNFDFFRQFHKKSISSDTFLKMFDFFRQFRNVLFSRQTLLIYSYFWANCSISLQKLPLSNIHVLPVHDK